MAAIVGGRVAYDPALRCFSLQNGGEKVPVVWPAGAVGTSDGPGVVLHDGSIVRVDAFVSGTGGYLSIASPLVSEYHIPADWQTPSDEVAMFNPGARVTLAPR
jgi:hypothetical protein